jgi:hypothetical protein
MRGLVQKGEKGIQILPALMGYRRNRKDSEIEQQPEAKLRRAVGASPPKHSLTAAFAMPEQEPLKAITAKRITEYRAWRASQTVEKKRGGTMQVIKCAGPATLNAELGILRRIFEASETLGACCRRYTVPERAVHHRAGIGLRMTNNGCSKRP